MSWYTEQSRITKSDGKGAHWSATHNPADQVPHSGIYRCLGCNKEVTSNAGDKFPPQNHHQHSQEQGTVRWRLNVRTNTEGK